MTSEAPQLDVDAIFVDWQMVDVASLVASTAEDVGLPTREGPMCPSCVVVPLERGGPGNGHWCSSCGSSWPETAAAVTS